MRTFEISLPQPKMTAEAYAEEAARLLESLPEAFRGFVSSRSYESGHSAGYDEVVMIMKELIYELAPCISAFREAVLESARRPEEVE